VAHNAANHGHNQSGWQTFTGYISHHKRNTLFILVLSMVVWQHDRAGVWVLLCGGMRYIFVAAGWLMPWLAGPLRSTRRGKTVAVGQLVGLGIALVPVFPVGMSRTAAAITLLALAWSFALDIGWLFRQSTRAGASG
jgi:hypothetical protein